MDLITLAVDRGVPLYNHGQHRACAAIYEIACHGLMMDLQSSCSACQGSCAKSTDVMQSAMRSIEEGMEKNRRSAFVEGTGVDTSRIDGRRLRHSQRFLRTDDRRYVGKPEVKASTNVEQRRSLCSTLLFFYMLGETHRHIADEGDGKKRTRSSKVGFFSSSHPAPSLPSGKRG